MILSPPDKRATIRDAARFAQASHQTVAVTELAGAECGAPIRGTVASRRLFWPRQAGGCKGDTGGIVIANFP
jgi:hypothetical protein